MGERLGEGTPEAESTTHPPPLSCQMGVGPHLFPSRWPEPWPLMAILSSQCTQHSLSLHRNCYDIACISTQSSHRCRPSPSPFPRLAWGCASLQRPEPGQPVAATTGLRGGEQSGLGTGNGRDLKDHSLPPDYDAKGRLHHPDLAPLSPDQREGTHPDRQRDTECNPGKTPLNRDEEERIITHCLSRSTLSP